MNSRSASATHIRKPQFITKKNVSVDIYHGLSLHAFTASTLSHLLLLYATYTIFVRKMGLRAGQRGCAWKTKISNHQPHNGLPITAVGHGGFCGVVLPRGASAVQPSQMPECLEGGVRHTCGRGRPAVEGPSSLGANAVLKGLVTSTE